MYIYVSFPQGKTKALTMSYDDGQPQDERLLQIFNRNGIKGTFHLVYDWLLRDYLSKQEIKERLNLLYQGHEIASHSLSHPTLERCPLTVVADQIMSDRKGLESFLLKPVRGFSYPNGSYSEEIKHLLKDLGIAYARVVPRKDDFCLPTDYYEWHPTCHHGDPDLMEKAKFLAEFNKKQYLKLMYVWGHSYEFDRDNNWNVIEEFCDYIGNREDIWYATNIEIVDYMEAAKRLQYTADHSLVYNPSIISVWLTIDGDRIVEVPGGASVSLV